MVISSLFRILSPDTEWPTEVNSDYVKIEKRKKEKRDKPFKNRGVYDDISENIESSHSSPPLHHNTFLMFLLPFRVKERFYLIKMEDGDDDYYYDDDDDDDFYKFKTFE